MTRSLFESGDDCFAADNFVAQLHFDFGVAGQVNVHARAEFNHTDALAGLHDGDPARWLQWATRNSRVELIGDGRDVLEQAVSASHNT